MTFNIGIMYTIFIYFFFSRYLQTITGAMSTLNPPIALEKPDNQARVDYIQDYASGEYFLFVF